MFSADDVEKLKQISHLVKERGMTLEGARKVMRGASGKELARETELLERLQRIRSALVEVREELKAGDDEQIVGSVGAESRDAEEVVVADVAQEEPKVENVAESDESQQIVTEQPQAELLQAEPQQAAAGEPDTATDAVAETENVMEPEAEQPAKKRVRRRKKSDDDNKELFPFYEQSLF